MNKTALESDLLNSKKVLVYPDTQIVKLGSGQIFTYKDLLMLNFMKQFQISSNSKPSQK